MFVNKWRKRVFYLWLVTIPLSLLAGLAKAAQMFLPYSDYLFLLGTAAAIAGLIILKTVGRPDNRVAH